MKILKMIPVLIIASLIFFSSCASGAEKRQEQKKQAVTGDLTRYPIVLVHGISLRDDNPIPYWGRVPDALRAAGYDVHLANHDAWASIEDNAASLFSRVEQIRSQASSEKVNIVAHSKGGLEARYAISSLGMASRVASLSTINTPHRGSVMAEFFLDEAPILNQFSAQVVDLISLLFLRDSNPNIHWATKQLCPSAMASFNQANPDKEGVYYQSWTSIIDENYGALPYVFVNKLLNERAGPNDGFVTVDSARWGRFRGVIGEERGQLISHSDVHGFIIFPEANSFDAPAFYLELAAELAGMGF